MDTETGFYVAAMLMLILLFHFLPDEKQILHKRKEEKVEQSEAKKVEKFVLLRVRNRKVEVVNVTRKRRLWDVSDVRRIMSVYVQAKIAFYRGQKMFVKISKTLGK